jgi:hypothetical protein
LIAFGRKKTEGESRFQLTIVAEPNAAPDRAGTAAFRDLKLSGAAPAGELGRSAKEGLTVSPVVAELENRLLPRLAEAARQIEQDFAAVRARSWSAPVGSLAEYQGQTVGLECYFSDAPPDAPDSLGLDITVRHLTTAPELAEAYVAWNSPSGACEIDLIEHPVPYSAEALAGLEARFGELIAAVRRAVARGKPPGWWVVRAEEPVRRRSVCPADA